jgi:hypothetical protein
MQGVQFYSPFNSPRFKGISPSKEKMVYDGDLTTVTYIPKDIFGSFNTVLLNTLLLVVLLISETHYNREIEFKIRRLPRFR